MQTVRSIVALPLIFMFALSVPALAQERHVVSPSVLTQTLASHVAQQDADRAAIHEALNRPDVRDIARKSGIDLDRINASVDTLSGNSLSDVAAAAQRVNETFVNQSLVGGASTIVISSTTIIIALLVIILIIVAVH